MDANQYREFSIGMDNFFSRVFDTPNSQGFPPYNIYRIGNNIFKVEIALAGYLKKDIEITIKDSLLTVKAINTPSNLYDIYEANLVWRDELDFSPENMAKDYVIELHKGISSKKVRRCFQLAENVKVTNAVFNEGILTIDLEQLIPEEKQLKVIEIK